MLVGLKAKNYSYLIDDGSEDKKAKGIRNCITRRKLKIKNHKNYLEKTQLDNKIKHLEKNKMNIDSLKRNHKKFMKNNKLILQTQQSFNSERYNVFTEEIN